MTIGLNGHEIEGAIHRLMARTEADDLPMRDVNEATVRLIGLAMEANNEQLEKDIVQLVRRIESGGDR